MNVSFLTFEQYHGRKIGTIGSSRIRADWLIKYWSEAERFVMGKEYDVVIYQKAYFIEHAKRFKGLKILDLCDPDFLDWRYKVVEMINECDVVTTSTEALRNIVSKFTDKPVIYIPDGMDFEFHREKKKHQGRAKWVVWFGYSTGFEMLKGIEYHLKRNNLGLIVIANEDYKIKQSYSIPLKNYKWELETINKHTLEGDIIINPQSRKGKWKFKSNNKTLSGWVLGIPVADNPNDLKRFLDEGERIKESEEKLEEVKKWDVKLNIERLKKIINENLSLSK